MWRAGSPCRLVFFLTSALALVWLRLRFWVFAIIALNHGLPDRLRAMCTTAYQTITLALCHRTVAAGRSVGYV